MRRVRGKILLGVSLLGALGGVVAIIGGGAGGAGGEAMADVGRFRFGAALGEERAGFSGRHKLFVFANPDAPGWVTLEACLRSAEVEAELAAFTPVLVDVRDAADRQVEAGARAAGFGVVIRGLDGAFLGGLAPAPSCGELVELLSAVRASMAREPLASPLCTLLRSEPAEAIDALLGAGEEETAARALDLLAEIDGDSAAVRRGRERLGR